MNVEEQIRRAIQEGLFDRLPGAGKPLPLDDNPLADPEWRAAHHMLRGSGFSLPWIEMLREIEAELQSARADLARSWVWQQAASADKQSAAFAAAEWERARLKFHERMNALNQRIRDYNLSVPSPRFQRTLLNPDREIETLTT